MTQDEVAAVQRAIVAAEAAAFRAGAEKMREAAAAACKEFRFPKEGVTIFNLGRGRGAPVTFLRPIDARGYMEDAIAALPIPEARDE